MWSQNIVSGLHFMHYFGLDDYNECTEVKDDLHARLLKCQSAPATVLWNRIQLQSFGIELGVQGWRSGESTHLPPMWPEFDSQIRHQMWVEFVGSLLCTERFSPGTPVSPLLKNQNLA